MSDDDDSEKPFEATPRKLEEARKRGEVPMSQDLITFGTYAAILTAIVTVGAWSIEKTGRAMQPYLLIPDRLAMYVFEEEGRQWHSAMLMEFGVGILPWFIMPVIFALSVAFLQGALVFSTQKLQPKLNRISPIKNAKQKYGAEGLFNFLKSFLKLLVYCAILAFVLRQHWAEILSMAAIPARQSLLIMASICFQFLAVSTVAMLAISVVDFFWQRAQFMRRQRMSLKELKDELKETEGDPFTKQARRQMAQDISTNQMLADVPDADVIVVNPEHYAVALKWERKRETAPICVAKGVDEIAARIREVATENAIPIFRDPPTARALFSTVDIGEEVTVDLYQAIAAAIRFADAMRMKARGGR
ncbi:MAG: flagellar type III secretion system protein FlhB [Paracoccaceae bacterium]